MIPESWAVTSLEEIAEITTGKTPPTSRRDLYKGSIPFVKPPSLRDGVIEDTDETISASGVQWTTVVPENAILVSCIGNLGKTGLTQKSSAFNQQINALVVDKNIEPRYVLYACQLLRPYLESQASATTISIVNKTKFSKATIPIAPKGEQRRIVAEIEKQLTRLDAAVGALRRLQANLRRYRASVLKAAVEGKLVRLRRRAWPTVPMNDVLVDIEAGKSFRCEERVPSHDEIGVVKVSAVTWGEYNENESKTCTDSSKVNPQLFVRTGDFLLSRANTIQLVGACVIAKKVSKNVMLSDKILRLTFNDKALPSWVLHYLRSEGGRAEIERYSTGNQES